MYSDMSMRTMARSSSKRNSARARASSVLPTPVGPRNRKRRSAGSGPTGRPGSGGWRWPPPPTASSWPTTRWWRTSSMRTSLSTSPSSRRLTGTPVHRQTTSATSSSSTSSLSIFWSVCSSASAGDGLVELRCSSSGSSPVLDLGRLGQVAVAGEALGLAPGRSSSSCSSRWRRWPPSRAASGRSWPTRLLAQVGQLLVELGQPLGRRRRRSPWPAPAARSRAGACAGRPRRSRSASSRSRCAAGWRPRRPGRWPCRAGTGR